MLIRKLQPADIPSVVEIWYQASLVAHNFIPAAYWQEHKPAMAETYLPNSETYLAVTDEQVFGFISLTGNYLAALFIRPEAQRRGIGKLLLDYVKEKRETIELRVYAKNSGSIAFYKNQGFTEISRTEDEKTGEQELLLTWSAQEE